LPSKHWSDAIIRISAAMLARPAVDHRPSSELSSSPLPNSFMRKNHVAVAIIAPAKQSHD